jgi:glycosyltransferase involved in cell wall biosynthesis
LTSLRILHVVHRMYPPCFGGLSLYADKICQLHARRGHRIEAWTTLEDPRSRVEKRLGYLVRRYPAAFTIFENPFAPSMMPDLLRYSSFDLIVAHSHLMFTSCFAAVKSLLSSAPLVLISHGYGVQRGPLFGVAQRAYISSIGRAIACKAKCVIAMTSREATRFRNLGVRPERCVIIPPGVDSTLFHPNRGSRLVRRIVWTGRFVPEKNLTCLLEAAALLKKKIPDVQLVLAGEGPERRKLMELSRTLGLDVKFPGILARDGIPDLLQGASLFALPSTSEAFPIALLEAMACGIPSVVSAGLGLEQIVDGAALIADHRIPHEWALKLEALLTNDNMWESMSMRAYELAARYDWNIVAERLERLFFSVVNNHTF